MISKNAPSCYFFTGNFSTRSLKAINKFKQVVRERIKVAFSLDDVAAVAYINQYLIGWAMYYRSVSSSQTFSYLNLAQINDSSITSQKRGKRADKSSR
jgi:hypothetical protein